MQLRPTEQFTIARQLADPQDSDTNFVRATVRNAKTDVLLSTVNLSNKTGQRFSGVYEVPADVSGEGFYITITTLVYTDAGYTTINPNYSAEMNTYLVQERPSKLQGGGGGGDDIDYKKVRKIVEEVIAKYEQDKAKSAEAVVTELNKVLTVLAQINAKDLNVNVEAPNLDPIFSEIKGVHKAITAQADKFEPTDTTALENAIYDLTDVMKIAFKKHEGMLDEIIPSIEEALIKFTDNKESFDDQIEEVVSTIEKSVKTLRKNRNLKPTEEELPEVEPEEEDEEVPTPAEKLRMPIKSPFNKPNL